MVFQETKHQGLLLVQLDPFRDNRGYFMRLWDRQLAEKHHLITTWEQESVSYSKNVNTIRGLHFQKNPYMETKFVTVLRGAVMDVVVDIRPDSPTMGEWESFILDESCPTSLYIPKGFAHGFKTLCNDCIMLYKMDVQHIAEYESGIIWNDQSLKIPWGISDPVISVRDNQFSTFTDYVQSIDGR